MANYYLNLYQKKNLSQAIINGDFFKCFKSISPDIQTIRNQVNILIKLAVKESNIKKLYISYITWIERADPEISGEDEVSVVNGTVEYEVSVFRTGYTSIDIRAKKDDKKEDCGWIDYENIFDE